MANSEEAQPPADSGPQAEVEAPLDPEALRQALNEQKAKAEEYLDQWKRARADFANLKKRAVKERTELLQFSNAELVSKLLPVVDDFDRALASLPVHLRGLTWLEGIILIHRKLQLLLEQEGVQALEVIGVPFDPNLHEAIDYEETSQHPDGHVIAEVQRGYRLGERILRPALVKVAKNRSPATPSETKEEH